MHLSHLNLSNQNLIPNLHAPYLLASNSTLITTFITPTTKFSINNLAPVVASLIPRNTSFLVCFVIWRILCHCQLWVLVYLTMLTCLIINLTMAFICGILVLLILWNVNTLILIYDYSCLHGIKMISSFFNYYFSFQSSKSNAHLSHASLFC